MRNSCEREKCVSGQRRLHRHRGLFQQAETEDRGAGESRNDGTEEAINYLKSLRPVSEASNLECKKFNEVLKEEQIVCY